MSGLISSNKIETDNSKEGLPIDPHPVVTAWLARISYELSPIEKRSLWIQDTLLKVADARGYGIGCPDADFSRMWIVIKGERVDWRLHERWCRRNIPLTKKELKRETDGKTWKQILVPTGLLIFTVKADHSCEKDIYERPKRPFENRAEEFLSKCEAMAAHAIEEKNYWADWQRRRLKKLARRDRMERLQAIEDERWSKLRRMAAEWEETERLRNFVDAVDERLTNLKDRPRRVDLWIEWARQRIDALDPFRSDPRFIYEVAVQKPRQRVLSDYEREFGEPDPDEDDD